MHPIFQPLTCKYGQRLALVALACILPGSAQAYIDPASGSLAMQLMLGAVFGMLATGKIWWAKCRALFSKKPTDTE